MSSPSIICILTVSFSESSPLSPLRHFLPPFSSIWPLTSQGPPAYAASAGLLSNQILTVKVCPSQPIIPASPDTCGHPCSQTSVPSYLTLFHFFFPTSPLFPQTLMLREDCAGWMSVSPAVITGIHALFLMHSVHLSHYPSSAVRWSSVAMSMAFSRLRLTITLFTGTF